MKLFADYHTHTRHSHGRGTVMENAIAARDKGLSSIAISDHGPASLFGVGIRNADCLLEIKAEICKAQKRVPEVKILLAVEANVISMDGELDIPASIASELDLVLCGMHHMVYNKTLNDWYRLFLGNFIGKLSAGYRDRVRKYNTEAIVNAVANNSIDIITHPGIQMPIDTDELSKMCATKGTALEINTSHNNATLEFIKLGKQNGVRFAIDSDAHTPSRVGDLQKGVELAIKAGLSSSDIINAIIDT